MSSAPIILEGNRFGAMVFSDGTGRELPSVKGTIAPPMPRTDHFRLASRCRASGARDVVVSRIDTRVTLRPMESPNSDLPAAAHIAMVPTVGLGHVPPVSGVSRCSVRQTWKTMCILGQESLIVVHGKISGGRRREGGETQDSQREVDTEVRLEGKNRKLTVRRRG